MPPRWMRTLARTRVAVKLRARLRGAPRPSARTAVVMAVVLGGVTLLGAHRVFSISCGSDPDCLTLAELSDGVPLPEPTAIYDGRGHLIGEIPGPRRRNLDSEQIPDLVADAFVAVEDRRFWEHSGVDTRGVIRAAFRNAVDGEISEGASTIPMQLVRTVWAEQLRNVGPWRRKVIEARTAPRLVDELGHERVLTLYLNAIYLGSGVYGVERAARHYFGAGVGDLDLGQIATLVGITRAPEHYEPRRQPDRAREVRDVVLSLLAEQEVVSLEAAEAAKAQDLDLVPLDSSPDVGERTHLTATVMRELRRVAPELAGRTGLQIYTTIDSIVQNEGESALLGQLDAIENGRYGRPAAGDPAEALEGAAVAIDPNSGAVLAWIGGRDFARSEFDRVEQARRQVGSLVKPFLVATAVDGGAGILDVVTADTVPIPVDGGTWLPADHVQETELPLREALVRSSNRAAAHLGVRLGPRTVPVLGERLGFSSAIPAVPSSSIGAFDASLLEMTAAYALFANRGHRVRPYLLERVEAADGRTLWSRERVSDSRVSESRPEPIVSEETAFVVLDAMRAVVDRGTAFPVRTQGYLGPAAGKTGTTNDGKDAWFVGLTPEMVAGVWIGFDLPREIVAGGGGGSLAGPVWANWMEEVHRSPRPRSGAWVPPPGVQRVWYDPVDGQVFGLLCRDRLDPRHHREAWVRSGRYELSDCPDGSGGLFRRLWRAVRGERGGGEPGGG